MCEQIGQLREAMGRYAAGFDASLLSCEDAAAVVAEAAAIENVAATVKGLAAARSAAGEGWKAVGARSAASHLARTTGTSVRQAGDVLDTARRLETLPALAAAARTGELSAAQVAAVADAAAVDPSAEARLVETARSSSLAELREHCGRTKAAARPDTEARRKAIHGERFLRAWTDADGAWNLRMRDNPEWARWSWPPSRPCGTGSSATPGPRAAMNRPRPTPPMPWWSWSPGPGREPARRPRSSCGSTCRRCCGARWAPGSAARSPASGPSRHRRCGI